MYHGKVRKGSNKNRLDSKKTTDKKPNQTNPNTTVYWLFPLLLTPKDWRKEFHFRYIKNYVL